MDISQVSQVLELPELLHAPVGSKRPGMAMAATSQCLVEREVLEREFEAMFEDDTLPLKAQKCETYCQPTTECRGDQCASLCDYTCETQGMP